MCADLIQLIQKQQQSDSIYAWKHELLWKDNKIVVPNNDALQKQLFHE